MTEHGSSVRLIGFLRVIIGSHFTHSVPLLFYMMWSFYPERETAEADGDAIEFTNIKQFIAIIVHNIYCPPSVRRNLYVLQAVQSTS